jgi:outer membrane protein
MRSYLLHFSLLLTPFASVEVCAQTVKLGHIDRNALVMAMPERLAATTKLDAFAKTLEGRLKAMGDEYTGKRAVLENPPATMTQTELGIAARELQELESRIVDAQEKAQEDLAKMEQELLKPIIQRADSAISTVAIDQSFTYVLDASGGILLHMASGIDLLPTVKAQLGIK